MVYADALAPDQWQPKPFREFVLKVHSRCDLSCDYCYVYKMADGSWRSQPRRMAQETVDQTAARIAEHARKYSLDRIGVVLHGGEPLLAGLERIEYIVKTIRSSTDAHVKFDMQTNALRLDMNYLELFDRLDIHLSVSLDGGEDAHDRNRRRADGQGSHEAVARSLELLTSGPFWRLFNGLVATIDLRNDPVEAYQHLLRFRPPQVDFLLPHGNWSAPPPGRTTGSPETPYGDWLVRVFDRWCSAPKRETRVRLFSEIMKTLLGRASTTELIGLSPIATVVIETDGSIEQSDILKSAFPGAAKTGLHVSRDSFDAALALPGFVNRQLGSRALSRQCQSCSILATCGGGLYAHRYHEDNGFVNPSVYCLDLFRIITHVRETMQSDLAAQGSQRP
jgi:uncharacterized protein